MNDPEIKDTTIIQSIRRSLRGTAKTMLIPVGVRASLFGKVFNNMFMR